MQCSWHGGAAKLYQNCAKPAVFQYPETGGNERKGYAKLLTFLGEVREYLCFCRIGALFGT